MGGRLSDVLVVWLYGCWTWVGPSRFGKEHRRYFAHGLRTFPRTVDGRSGFSFRATPDWVGSRYGNRDKRVLDHDRVWEGSGRIQADRK